MEHNQSTQQHSTDLSDSKPKRSLSPLKQRYSANVAVLIRRCPWLFWTGVLAFLFTVTAISLSSLIQTQTDSVTQPEPEPMSVTTENTTETSPNPRHLFDLWLLGAIALSFVAGSLVITKQLNISFHTHQFRQRVKYFSARELTRRQLRKRRLQVQPPPASATIEPVVIVPLLEAKQILDSTASLATVTAPSVKENQALDSGAESLAEMMDIRKHLTLSAILADCDKFRIYQGGFNRQYGNTNTSVSAAVQESID